MCVSLSLTKPPALAIFGFGFTALTGAFFAAGFGEAFFFT